MSDDYGVKNAVILIIHWFNDVLIIRLIYFMWTFIMVIGSCLFYVCFGRTIWILFCITYLVAPTYLSVFLCCVLYSVLLLNIRNFKFSGCVCVVVFYSNLELNFEIRICKLVDFEFKFYSKFLWNYGGYYFHLAFSFGTYIHLIYLVFLHISNRINHFHSLFCFDD